jgi:hypothetical protein
MLIIRLIPLLCLMSCIQTSQVSPTLFSLMDPDRSGIRFKNTLPEDERFNIIEYLYFYNGGGVATGDINGDNLPDLFFTSNTGEDILYLNKGNFRFESIALPDQAQTSSGTKGIDRWKTGVTMADINGDGWLDIYVCEVGNYKGLRGKNRLYINQQQKKKPAFKEEAALYGLDITAFSTQSAFFDYDRDGDLDLFLLTHSVHSPGSYRDTSQRGEPDAMAGDRLLRNELLPAKGLTGKKFTDVTREAGIYQGKAGYGLGLSIADFNADGWPDIYVGNDFHENDYLYYNNGNGTFSEQIASSMGHTSMFSMGNDAADINNDGWCDLITMDMKPEDEPTFKESALNDSYDIYEFKRSKGYGYQYARNCLQVNRGVFQGERGARFSEVAQLSGLEATDWSWSALMADFDNDGWKDIYITNGIVRRPIDLDYLQYQGDRQIQARASDLEIAKQMPSGVVSNYAFRNRGDLRFEKIAAQWGLRQSGLSNGAAYADLDNDGDLDLVVNNINTTAFVFRNNANKLTQKNHYIKVRLQGPAGNPFGVGARVSLYYDGQVNYREMQTTHGFLSACDPVLHFGLGDRVQVDSVVVFWPDGKRQVMPNVAVDGTLTPTYQPEAASPQLFAANGVAGGWVSKIRGGLRMPYRHEEDPFMEANTEKLIPRLLSSEGPAIATGDINGDGLEDVFAGGSSGQGGIFLLQDKKGMFSRHQDKALLADKDFEDVDAVLFDADGDGDRDLYVVSGGNRYRGDHRLAKDRLYLNDGKGHFSRSTKGIPGFSHNGACVRPADFDGDGDTDLFIGSRSLPGQYGETPDSYLLQNDGKGHFTDVTDALAPELRHVGMITGAAWADMNNNKNTDLVLCGDWMPIVIFYWTGNKFRKKVLTGTDGWWCTLRCADIDGDGDNDIIAGNIGYNTFLRAEDSYPMHLYVKDLDNNGSNELLWSYFRQATAYPFATKDEIVAQYPAIRKQYVSYREYAHATFEEIFPPAVLKDPAVHLQSKQMASSVFLNAGTGEFEKRELPMEAQWSSVRDMYIADLNEDGHPDLLLAGNDYGMQPAVGRFDAGYGVALAGDGKGNFKAVNAKVSGFEVAGQVRYLKLFQTAFGGKFLLAARNNETLEVFQVRSVE